MKRLTGRVSLAASIALALFFAAAAPVSAQPASAGFLCGRVTAYSAPTATTDGSIGIGTTTFVLRAGSLVGQPPPITIGALTCIDGRRDASGAFIASFGITTLGDSQICGPVTSFTPATATGPGSITIAIGQLPPTLPVRVGVSLSPTQTTGSQCFKWVVYSGDGNAEVINYIGPASSAPANQLPSTSTGTSGNTAAVVLILLGAMAVSAGAIWRSRRFASALT